MCTYTNMCTFKRESNCEWTAAVIDWSESSRCKWWRARWLWMMFRIEWEFIAFETPPPFSWRGWGKLHIRIMTEGVLCFGVCVSHNSPESKRSRKWDNFYHGELNEKNKNYQTIISRCTLFEFAHCNKGFKIRFNMLKYKTMDWKNGKCKKWIVTDLCFRFLEGIGLASICAIIHCFLKLLPNYKCCSNFKRGNSAIL
jgi:hypothetical protein